MRTEDEMGWKSKNQCFASSGVTGVGHDKDMAQHSVTSANEEK